MISFVLIERAGSRERDERMLGGYDGFSIKAKFDCAMDAMPEIGLLSPQVILLDTDAQDTDLIAGIRNLLMRSPGSKLFCLSDDWDEQKQYDCIGAGARGFLVRPLSHDDILQAISAGESAPRFVDGEIFAFFSPKGKSGKTTLIANMGLALARRTKETVAIIDADVQFGDLAVFFNLEPETTILEAARDVRHLSPAALDAYFAEVNEHVKVLCGVRRPQMAEHIYASDLNALLALARLCYRYVLVDLPQGFNPVSVTAAESADRVYLVTMVGGAYECRHLSRSVEVFRSMADYANRVKVVFTRVADCGEATRRDLEEKIGHPVAGMLPNAYLLVAAAANDGRMALDVKPDSPLSLSIAALIDDIVTEGGARP